MNENNPTSVAFKHCSRFNKCITKIDKTAKNDAEDLNLVLPVYNMIEYSSNHLKQQEFYGFIEKTKQLILCHYVF